MSFFPPLQAYAPDARNHGESFWSEEFNDQLLMEDLFCFMDDIKAPKAVLIGHSLGGSTACKATLTVPERVEMLFVEDMLARKLDQEDLNHLIRVLNTLKQVEPSIPQGMDKEELKNFITAHVFQKMHPDVPLDQIFQDKPYPFFSLCKDSSGRYRFATNLDVIIEKLQDVDSIMKDCKGIYNGPTYFIYGTKSFLHV
ncbi:UNVERIFIED_CONTAM: esterase/lipase [Trichonephila clavipes]